MIELRHFQTSDSQSLEFFDLGMNRDVWLDEVRERPEALERKCHHDGTVF